MSKSIPNVDWANQLENAIRQFVKEKLELIMREEIKHFLEIEQAGTPNMRNGYYQRNLDMQYGRIEGLLVPRDRNGEFQTQLKIQKQYVDIFFFVSAQLSQIQFYLQRRNRHLVKQEDAVIIAIHLLGKLLGFSSERAWNTRAS